MPGQRNLQRHLLLWRRIGVLAQGQAPQLGLGVSIERQLQQLLHIEPQARPFGLSPGLAGSWLIGGRLAGGQVLIPRMMQLFSMYCPAVRLWLADV
jgi:hypothetical protein